MPITLDRIYRFPVKGLQGERLEAVRLGAGQGLPHDRRFAIARGDTRLDPQAPHWLPKQWFVMLMRDTELARITCRLDTAAGTIALQVPGAPAYRAPYAGAAGRRGLEAFVNAACGARREGPVRWVEAGKASFTDVPQNCLSLINLESVRELEAHLGRPVHPLRFRANLYLRGAPPWAEFDWVGHEIRIGDTMLGIPSRIPRCAATAVNPESGVRDVNIVQGLRGAYGHYDMGVYAEVVTGGRIAVGDVVTPPANPQPRSWAGHWLRFFSFLARSAPIVLRRR